METFSGLAMDIALSFVMMKPLVLSMIVPLIPICVLTVSLSLSLATTHGGFSTTYGDSNLGHINAVTVRAVAHITSFGTPPYTFAAIF